MDTSNIINNPDYLSLLQRHFQIRRCRAQHEQIYDVCRRQHSTYHALINACIPLLETSKGLFAYANEVVVFLSQHGDVFPVSTTLQGIPAAIFRSHAFIDRSGILSNPEDFLKDAGHTFPWIRDWAAHTKDAKNVIKTAYNIPHLDDF